tara:strand:- start:201 stop:971 length:771 start_codon:yes stop_codon:yes gene_type:complete
MNDSDNIIEQEYPEDFRSGDIKTFDRDGAEVAREEMKIKRGGVLQNQGQRPEEIDGKLTIKNVQWIDEERTLVRVSYFDSEGWGRVENHAANSNGEGTFFSKVLQVYTIDDIDKDTAEFWKAEQEVVEELQQFREWKSAGGLLGSHIDEDELRMEIENEVRMKIEEEGPSGEPEVVEKIVEKVEEIPVEVPTISVEHMAKNYSQEDLFRMKIEVFDIPAVRAASKDIKSRIRKSSTPVELFSIIHEANVSFESEQA